MSATMRSPASTSPRARPPSASTPPPAGSPAPTSERSARSSTPPRANSSAAQDQTTRRDSGAGGHERVLDRRDLVHRGAPHLANCFGDAVHPVDVGLTELTAVGVEGQSATDFDRAVGDETGRLPAPAEAELLQLHEDVGREVVIQHGRLDVVRSEARLPPELAT